MEAFQEHLIYDAITKLNAWSQIPKQDQNR
jgi:hypothetical protein